MISSRRCHARRPAEQDVADLGHLGRGDPPALTAPESSPPFDACSHSSQKSRQRRERVELDLGLAVGVGAEHGQVLAGAQVRGHRSPARRPG